MDRHSSDALTKEPEVKYLVEDMCEAYQDGIAIWDSRVKNLLIGSGRDVEAAIKLRSSFEEGIDVVGRSYRQYYKQAGKHFAVGDSKIQSKLAYELHVLTTEVVEVLQHAHEDAITGIPCLPSSFNQYQVINFIHLRQKSDFVSLGALGALQRLFSEISDWAVPLHTLPPLATVPTTSTSPEAEEETEGFFERIKAPFHRTRYAYDELPTQYSFRLVRILTSRPYVTCEVETFHLTDPPPFQALSYCWGKHGQNAEIWCNERLFKVTSTLKKGLQRLHKYGAWSRVKWFWIDQICINQSEAGKAERTQQVRLMRAIYQRSRNTVIWLGRDDGNTRDAFSLTNDIYQLSLGKVSKMGPIERAFTTESQTKLPPAEDQRWTALSRFLEMPWFERCWIIQEVVVSPGDPVLLCGGFQTLWSRFQEAMMLLITYNPSFRTDRMKLINGIFELSSASEMWELQALLYSTRAFQATDSRDKVFALLGLSGESRAPDSWPKALMPNYDRSTRNIYQEVTLYCIQRTKTLTILSQVEGSSDSNENAQGLRYSSWVPRWDLPQLATNLSAYTVVESSAHWRMLTEKFHNASKDLRVSQDSYTPPGVLRLEGVRVSAVESCLPATSSGQQSPSSSTTSLIGHAHPELLKTLPELYQMCRSREEHLTTEDFMKTFFLVTTAGLTPEKDDARDEPLSHFREFLLSTMPGTPQTNQYSSSMFSLHAALKSNLSISTLTPSLSPPASMAFSNTPSLSRSHSSPTSLGITASTTSLAEQRPDPSRYTSALTPLLHRRLFITSSGHLGLGPASMMSGDIVAVLFGGKVPFVLRRVEDDQWKLVGECYVDGFMQGEALTTRGEGKGLEHEWFGLI